MEDATSPPAHDEATTPPHPSIQLKVAAGADAGTVVRCNSPTSVFSVETDAFVGRIYMRLRGMPNEPVQYFSKNRSVRMSAVVQGRFKRQGLTMSDCATGYEFEQPLAHLPARIVIRTVLRIAQSFAPTMVQDMTGVRPYLLNPMFQTIQALHVAESGAEPPITALVEERTDLLGGIFAQRAVSSGERKRYFASLARAKRHAIDTSHVYTMEFSEDKIEPKTFELLLMSMRFKLSSYLRSQPLSYPMGKIGFVPFSQDYLFNVQLHHEMSSNEIETTL